VIVLAPDVNNDVNKSKRSKRNWKKSMALLTKFVGSADGLALLTFEGAADGFAEIEGFVEGALEGSEETVGLGEIVGDFVGFGVGAGVGFGVGFLVGEAVRTLSTKISRVQAIRSAGTPARRRRP